MSTFPPECVVCQLPRLLLVNYVKSCYGVFKWSFHLKCIFASKTDLDSNCLNWKCKQCYDMENTDHLVPLRSNNDCVNPNNTKHSEDGECDSSNDMLKGKSKMKTLYYDLEHKELQEFYSEGQKEFLKSCKQPELLENAKAEYPFKWSMYFKFTDMLNTNIADKLEDYKNQGPDYGFEKICYLLTLMFIKLWLHCDGSDDDSSDDDSKSDCENKEDSSSEDEYSLENAYTLCRKALDDMANHEGDVMYTRIGDALEHVVSAMRAHILYRQGDIASSKKIVENLQPVSDMNIENQAGIEGIKGRFILCFYKDARKALEPSIKAVEMDPTFGAWYYQTGKIMRRLRRECKEDIVKEEVGYFEDAVKLERNPKYLVYLAQAYQEMSFFIGRNRLSEEVCDLEKKASQLFREAWCLQNDSAAICRRIGNGMVKLNGGYQDIVLSKEALKKSIELVPSSKATIHQLGVLYYKVFKDDDAALECFQRVKDIYGTANEINLKLIKDPSYDPEEQIEYWRKISIGLSKRDILYCEIGWYYLFFKNDLTMSVKYFWRVLKTSFNSFRVLEFQSFAFCVKSPINMLEVLVNEIVLMKEKKIPQGKNEDMDFLEAVLEKVYEKHHNMREIKPDPNLKQSIKSCVDREITSMRKKRYGYGKTKTVRESGSSWRRQESQPQGNVDESIDRNWRRMDSCESDGGNKFVGGFKNSKDRESESASYRCGSGRFERGFRVGNNNNGNDFKQQDRESESASYRYGSGRFERGFRDGNNNSGNDFKQQGGFNRSSEDYKFNAAHRDGKYNRRQFTGNSSRYDVTITDWRSENKNAGN